ncbi:MAG: cation diffusion facilitator family transporter [Acidimicrobiales bacterium]
MPNSHHHGAAASSTRPVVTALCLIAGFFVAEIICAILGSSLVLFADAGHMITDVLALAMSAWALRLARRPPAERFTYGLRRAEIVSAAMNGVTLVAVALVIAVEAIQRLVEPHQVNGTLVLVVALVGAAINIVASRVLGQADHSNLNVRGAYLHVLTDLYAFVASAIAGLVIVTTHWQRADAVASLVVVVLMAFAAWGLLRDAGRILLQGTPHDLDLLDVRTHLVRVDHVLDVHDLHAWSVASDFTTLSAHVVVESNCFDDGRAPQILDQLQTCLLEHFAVEHATFQLEPASHESHEEGLHP